MEIIEKKDTWEEFVEWVKQQQEIFRTVQKQDTGHYSKLLFRGQSDASWKLETTLRRYLGTDIKIQMYYNRILRSRPHIETFTERSWEISDQLDIEKYLDEGIGFGGWPGHEYLVYLRHFGFPSPLLDWSASPYVAAFFAYENARLDDEVAIYCYQEFTGHGKSWSSSHPRIHTFGNYSHGHKRHHLQQSHYTISKVHQDKSWYFSSHDDVFAADELNQDRLSKIILPGRERKKVLSILDEYNLNSFSLFQNEESLLKTVAFREFMKD